MIEQKRTIQGRVLLLQGPIGPFFSLLAEELKSEGHEVFKINFNGGDEACYTHGGAQRYTGGLAGWPDFLADFITHNSIDRIFLFGDCRPYHLQATKIARGCGVAVFVFEEGYVRPDYITMEPGGVNGFSSLSRDPATYNEVPARTKRQLVQTVGNSFWALARYAAKYYLAAWRRRWAFPDYAHHRPLKPLSESLCWLRSMLRKPCYTLVNRPLLRQLSKRPGSYFLAPLQVHCDAQIVHHSRNSSCDEFIDEVIHSFANHAPANTELVFKHHPMDRGYSHYGRLIDHLAEHYGVYGRVRYLHEGHLPTLLRGARGTVTVNSTVGLSSAFHRTPVKVMGYAVYDMRGLTCQETLADFWRAPGEVDHQLYKRYRQHLVTNVLGNGSFYRPVRSDRGATGIDWPFGSITEASNPSRAGAVPDAQRGRLWLVAGQDLAESGNTRNVAKGDSSEQPATPSAAVYNLSEHGRTGE